MTKKNFAKITIFLILVATFFVGANFIINKIKNSEYFVIKSIRINGVYNSDKKKIDKEIKKFIGKNIFKINFNKPFYIDDKWVEKIRISRNLPDKLVINIFEKKSSFIFKQAGRCYHYIIGGDKIRTSCKKYDVLVSGRVDSESLDKFAKIYSKYLKNQNAKITLYPSYFKIVNNNFLIKTPYDEKTFATNKYYFENAIEKRYSEIEYVDLRVKGKIYVSGVIDEAG